MNVNLETLKSVNGASCTIELTINGKTETVRCWNMDYRDLGRAWIIYVYGIACKFQTGDKVWPAQVTFWPESNKITTLEPVNYSRVNGRRRQYQLVGFESEFVESANRSQHNGGYKN